MLHFNLIVFCNKKLSRIGESRNAMKQTAKYYLKDTLQSCSDRERERKDEKLTGELPLPLSHRCNLSPTYNRSIAQNLQLHHHFLYINIIV